MIVGSHVRDCLPAGAGLGVLGAVRALRGARRCCCLARQLLLWSSVRVESGAGSTMVWRIRRLRSGVAGVGHVWLEQAEEAPGWFVQLLVGHPHAGRAVTGSARMARSGPPRGLAGPGPPN